MARMVGSLLKVRRISGRVEGVNVKVTWDEDPVDNVR